MLHNFLTIDKMEKLTSEQLLEIRDNPNVQKFMDIIGTLESGNRYNVITGGETFDDDSKHPDKFGVKTADGVSDRQVGINF